MHHYLIFGFGFLVGAGAGLIIAALLGMAGRESHEEELRYLRRKIAAKHQVIEALRELRRQDRKPRTPVRQHYVGGLWYPLGRRDVP